MSHNEVNPSHEEHLQEARRRVAERAKRLVKRGPKSAAWAPFCEAVWKLEELEEQRDAT